MTGIKKCRLVPQAKVVLAARCCCPHFVPNWCCRGDVYFRRVTQIVEERKFEFPSRDELKMSGRDI
jgi:hypothetical protein